MPKRIVTQSDHSWKTEIQLLLTLFCFARTFCTELISGVQGIRAWVPRSDCAALPVINFRTVGKLF